MDTFVHNALDSLVSALGREGPQAPGVSVASSIMFIIPFLLAIAADDFENELMAVLGDLLSYIKNRTESFTLPERVRIALQRHLVGVNDPLVRQGMMSSIMTMADTHERVLARNENESL